MKRDQQTKQLGIETETIDGMAVQIGRDPREMDRDELKALGHEKLSVLQAIRSRCIDCCAGSPVEVRRCTSVYCPSWPFRMGFDPWRERRKLDPAQREALAARLAAARAARR